MKIKPQKSLFTKIILSNILLLICLLFLIFFSTNLIRDFLNKKQLNKEMARLNKEIAELTDKNQELKNISTYLGSQDYVEEEARSKLNMKKPGEEIIIISSSSTSPTDQINNNASKIIMPKPTNNLKNWWNYFFSHS